MAVNGILMVYEGRGIGVGKFKHIIPVRGNNVMDILRIQIPEGLDGDVYDLVHLLEMKHLVYLEGIHVGGE